MSVVTPWKACLVAAAIAAAAGGGNALANQPVGPVNHPGGPIYQPGLNPNVPACAAGFTATPSTIDGASVYNQSYTCTGPAIVCSPHFSP